MATEIIFKKRFNNKVASLLKYLEKEWNRQTAEQFLKKLDKRLSTLKEQPFIGSSSEIVKGVRGLLITKHNKLFYKISGSKIIILDMFDTRQNPKKSPY